MFLVGLDLGKRHDPAAIAVVERVDRGRAFQPAKFERLGVRHVERLALGTPYPRVVERVREVVQHEELRQNRCVLVVDATGVGEPVVDLLRRARLGCEICAVTITGGEHARANGLAAAGGGWSVPKQDLIAAVQVLLEHDELRISRNMRDWGWLVRELLDIQSTARSTGRARLGADGWGQHDDLVIALALACWRAKRGQNQHGVGPLPGVTY